MPRKKTEILPEHPDDVPGLSTTKSVEESEDEDDDDDDDVKLEDTSTGRAKFFPTEKLIDSLDKVRNAPAVAALFVLGLARGFLLLRFPIGEDVDIK